MIASELIDNIEKNRHYRHIRNLLTGQSPLSAKSPEALALSSGPDSQVKGSKSDSQGNFSRGPDRPATTVDSGCDSMSKAVGKREMIWVGNWPYWWIPPIETDLFAEAKRLGFDPLTFQSHVARERAAIRRT